MQLTNNLSNFKLDLLKFSRLSRKSELQSGMLGLLGTLATLRMPWFLHQMQFRSLIRLKGKSKTKSSEIQFLSLLGLMTTGTLTCGNRLLMLLLQIWTARFLETFQPLVASNQWFSHRTYKTDPRQLLQLYLHTLITCPINEILDL